MPAMAVSFDLQGGLLLVLARGVAVAALLGVFGALLFNIVVAPRALGGLARDEVDALERRLRGVVRLAACAGLLALPVWLVLQAAAMADAASVSETFAAISAVVTDSRFGLLICLQFLVLLATAALAWGGAGWRARWASPLAGLGVLLQAGHSHAFAMAGWLCTLLVADGVHLLAAGAWLGGLVPLLVIVRHAPPRAAALAARWFSPLGKWCVAAMAVTAAYQGWELVASIPGLVGTAYGWMALVKIVLFGVLVGFACANRYCFAPGLWRGAETARATLVRSIVLQSGFALAVIGAASVLSQLPPSVHTQPLWPFGWQFSLAAMHEDEDIRREVVAATLIFAGGFALLVTGVFLRRRRTVALGAVAAAIAAFWWSMPHFGALLVDAYPTSFYHSPTGFSAATIAAGQGIFAANCVSCHAADGHGDGPIAKSLSIPPADLTASHLWMHPDGQLFWWLTHGMENPEGGMAMPGFAGALDADERWAVIDYIRAHNAGAASHGSGTWPRAVRAPGFTARCDGRDTALEALRGHFVRVVIGAAPAAPFAQSGLAVRCFSADEAVADAYAIIAGLDNSSVRGTEFLIDAQGWLRAMHLQGALGGWDNDKVLAATVARLQRENAASPSEGAVIDMNMPGMKM
jgi:putative copper export protein/mono/diheme cytochrome c family protein